MNRGYRGRRAFLATTLKAAGGFAWSPAFLRQASARPGIPYGVSSGDVTRDRAIIWSRTDRPARMLVEWSTTESFQNAHRVRGPATGEPSGTPRVSISPGCRPINASSIACSSRISPNRAASACLTAAVFSPHGQPLATSRWHGRQTPSGRAGVSTRNSAACGCTTRSVARSPTCSFTAATRSTRTRRSPTRFRSRTEPCGRT